MMFENDSVEFFLLKENPFSFSSCYRPTLMECILLILFVYVFYMNYYFPVKRNYDRIKTEKTDETEPAENDCHVSKDARSSAETLKLHENLIGQLLQGQSLLRNSLLQLNLRCDVLQTDVNRLKLDLLSGAQSLSNSEVKVSEIEKQTNLLHEPQSPGIFSSYKDALKHGVDRNNTENKHLIHRHENKAIPLSDSESTGDTDIDTFTDSKHPDGPQIVNTAHAQKLYQTKDMINQKYRNATFQKEQYGDPKSQKVSGQGFMRDQNKHPRSNNWKKDMHEDDKNSLPKVLLIHDSTMKFIDSNRLGLSYHVNVTKKLCYTVEGIQSILQNELKDTSYEAVYIHCGINNIKNQDPKAVALRLIPIIQKLHQQHPKLKIVLSRIAPTKFQKLEHKRAIFNSTLISECYGKCKNLSIVLHENVRKHHLRQDGIHPLRQATSTLAMNVGRCLRDLFWDPPNRVMKKISDDWWARHITSY